LPYSGSRYGEGIEEMAISPDEWLRQADNDADTAE